MTRLTSHRGHEIRVISNPFAPAPRRVSRIEVAGYAAILAFAIFVATTVAQAVA